MIQYHTEVQLELPIEHQDAAEGLFYLADADGISIEDHTTGVGEYHRPLREGNVRIIGYFPEDQPLEFLPGLLSLSSEAEVTLRRVDLSIYQNRWKAYFKPAKLSERLWVCPSWEELPAPLAAHERLIRIDPGAAFGTGLHETTRQCIQYLDKLLSECPGAMLDVGTGSGILAIAAALLGANPVLAVDNDPLAVDVAKENAEINNCQEIAIDTRSVEEISERFEIVVANILAATLVTLREALWARVAPGGALVLAGLLAREREVVRDLFLESLPGATEEAHEVWGEWACLLLRAPA